MSRRYAGRAERIVSVSNGPTSVAEEHTPLWRSDIAIVAVLALSVAVYRLVMMSSAPGPPGSDGGNWLAFTRDLFGRSDKAAESMYFPGTLVVLKAFLLFLPELAALKLLAIVSSVALVVPFYFLARLACSRFTAAFLSLLFLMAGFLIEMMAWGGYPQLLGTLYLLAVFFFLDRWLLEGVRRDLLLAAVCTGLIFFTHHFTVLVLFASLAVYLPFIAFRERHRLTLFLRRVVLWGLAAGGLSLWTLPWYLRYFSMLYGDGTLNATEGQVDGFSGVLSYVFSEAPLTWIALATIVPLLALVPVGGGKAARLRPFAAALVLGPCLVYALTEEARSVQPMQAGILLSLGIVTTVASSYISSLEVGPRPLFLARATQAMAAIALLLILVPNSHSRFENALSRYGALDAQAVQALTWLRHSTEPGSLVLPGDRDNWVSYAWWVEGYGHRPAYAIIDPRYLAFKEEQQQSAIAQRIVDESTPVEEVEQLLRESGIRYLFIYKPSGGVFQNLVDRIRVYLSFENEDFAILKIAEPTASAQ
ncbi:MAG TPA: hypothetical protein VJB57_07965 [Dehalococcoidia bacterium]|nr:hypothetical protein [Dehalococcoidia bacterium]